MSEQTKKVPIFRKGKVLLVDPQVVRWQRRMRRYKAIKREAVETLSSLPSEARLDFWQTPNPKLNGKTPIEALQPPLIANAERVLSQAKAYVKAWMKVHSVKGL